MSKESRNREVGCKGTGNCAAMSICKLPEKGTSQCAKRRCNRYKDPKNPKYRK